MTIYDKVFNTIYWSVVTTLVIHAFRKEIVSWIRHRLKRNEGHPEVWRRPDGYLMTGFKCHECDKMHQVAMAPPTMQPWISGIVECEDCKQQWVSVRMLGVRLMECPKCKSMTLAKEVAA